MNTGGALKGTAHDWAKRGWAVYWQARAERAHARGKWVAAGRYTTFAESVPDFDHVIIDKLRLVRSARGLERFATDRTRRKSLFRRLPAYDKRMPGEWASVGVMLMQSPPQGYSHRAIGCALIGYADLANKPHEKCRMWFCARHAPPGRKYCAVHGARAKGDSRYRDYMRARRLRPSTALAKLGPEIGTLIEALQDIRRVTPSLDLGLLTGQRPAPPPDWRYRVKAWTEKYDWLRADLPRLSNWPEVRTTLVDITRDSHCPDRPQEHELELWDTKLKAFEIEKQLLPQRDRCTSKEILKLWRQGLTKSQIATHLEVSRAAISMQITRNPRKLKKLFKSSR